MWPTKCSHETKQHFCKIKTQTSQCFCMCLRLLYEFDRKSSAQNLRDHVKMIIVWHSLCLSIRCSCQWRRADQCQVSPFVGISSLSNCMQKTKTSCRTTIWMPKTFKFDAQEYYCFHLWMDRKCQLKKYDE